MFKKTLQLAQQLNGTRTVSVPITADDDGYVDKECPAENCRFAFKVFAADWSTPIFADAAVFCPQCRHEAPSKQWYTTGQVEHVRQMAMNFMKNAISKALQSDAQAFNRAQPRNSFVKMSMRFSGQANHPVDVPAPVAESLQLKLQCDSCSARFAVLGTAFFCPACGTNLIERVFDDAMKKIRAKLDACRSIESAVTARLGKDEAVLVVRSLIEAGLQEVVTAFQSFAEEHYRRRFPAAPAPQKNVFQRVSDGSDVWRSQTGRGYDHWLTASEISLLVVVFQRRHLLAHKDGKVDQEYVAKTGDATYRAGQRLVVTADEVREAVALIEKLVAGLRNP